MVRINIILGFVLGVFLLSSCKKPSERSCFKSLGEEKTIEIDLSYLEHTIDTLVLRDDIDYVIIQGEETKIELTGGENMLPFIAFEADNRKLTITNENKCSFLRSYKKDKLEARIYVNQVHFIEYFGSKTLRNEDTLKSNELWLFVVDGAADIELTVDVGYMSAIMAYGFGNYILNGYSMISFLHCNKNSYCDARDFHTSTKLYVTSTTQGEMLINANNAILEAEIYNDGNVKYIGEPAEVNLLREGNGELIKM